MKDTVRLGIIGLGNRGTSLLESVVLCLDSVCVGAVCDLHADRAEHAQALVKKKTGKSPFCTTDYRTLLDRTDIDAVLIATDWDTHIPVAVDCMRHNKAVALEVGGAYSFADCDLLVRTQEQTQTPFMLLENCCYGKTELLIGNMVRQGIFGEIVHCSGAYGHDLRHEIANGQRLRHYRQHNYMSRNCENYPTHELGPIAQILNVNRGNRMLTLSSTASKAAGLRDYLIAGQPADAGLDPYGFRQADIVITNITCYDGSTIMLKLDTTLPRFYSREFTVRGTKGGYTELGNSVYIDGKFDEFVPPVDNLADYESYLPPLWQAYQKNTIGGHGGMDYLILSDFVRCLLCREPMPIDVYDAAAWMCVSYLSEQSVALGGAPVPVPDFTGGAWLKRKPSY